jgi:hypothetical protein
MRGSLLAGAREGGEKFMSTGTQTVASAAAEKPDSKEPGIRGMIIVTGSITRGYWSDAFDLAQGVVMKLWEEDVGIHGYHLSWDGPGDGDATALLTIDAEGRDVDEPSLNLWARVTEALRSIEGTKEWRITSREVWPR